MTICSSDPGPGNALLTSSLVYKDSSLCSSLFYIFFTILDLLGFATLVLSLLYSIYSVLGLYSCPPRNLYTYLHSDITPLF